MPAFWDASAVLPLCVRAQASNRARKLLAAHDPVIWWACPVEVASALARLHREHILSVSAYHATMEKLAAMLASWRQVLPDDQVRETALRQMERFPLKAADAMHLAAALVWSRHNPRGRLFVCNDASLGSAASASGFEVVACRT